MQSHFQPLMNHSKQYINLLQHWEQVLNGCQRRSVSWTGTQKAGHVSGFISNLSATFFLPLLCFICINSMIEFHQTLTLNIWPTTKNGHFFIFSTERYILWDIKSVEKFWIPWWQFFLWFFKVLSKFAPFGPKKGQVLKIFKKFLRSYYHPLGVYKILKKFFWIASSI